MSEAPPACWKVKDWLEEGILAYVSLITSKIDVPQRAVLV